MRKLWVLVTHLPPDSALAAGIERARVEDATAREDHKTSEFIRRREARLARLKRGGGG